MSFKGISYQELWQPLDWNHLCNIGRRHHEEQSCKNIEFGPVVQEEMQLKFLILSSDSPFVQLSIIICAILVEGIQRNNSVKLF